MKFTCTLFLVSIALVQTAALAQTPAPAKAQPTTHTATAAHTATATHPAVHACITLPALSPKIPALPAGAPCAKALYTLTTVPNIKVEYVAPEEGAALKDTLGLDSTTFSLAYIDTKVGTGELAAPHKWYTIHYSLYLADGTKIESSLDPGKEPLVFPVGQHQVIAGWDTGFAGMHIGGKRRLFIPFQLGYGPQAHGGIPPKSELIFDLELISQSDEKPVPKTPPTPPAANKSVMPQPGGGSGPAPSPKPATPPASAPPASQPTATPPSQPTATPPKPQ
jgi:peptidylprolyl isomerase